MCITPVMKKNKVLLFCFPWIYHFFFDIKSFWHEFFSSGFYLRNGKLLLVCRYGCLNYVRILLLYSMVYCGNNNYFFCVCMCLMGEFCTRPKINVGLKSTFVMFEEHSIFVQRNVLIMRKHLFFFVKNTMVKDLPDLLK